MATLAGKSGRRTLLPAGASLAALGIIAILYLLRRKIWAGAQLWIVSVAIAGLPLHDGDLIFQTSRSAQSVAIQHATGSPCSHMGLIRLRGGQPYVLEASATVRYTPLARWVMRGVGHHFDVKRLRDADRRLAPAAVALLDRSAATFVGRPYDLTFEWSDDRIYCSELVWKIYDRALGIQIGALQRIRDFNLGDPLVAGALKQRYGTAIPLDEPVISPVAMFESPLLVEVASR